MKQRKPQKTELEKRLEAQMSAEVAQTAEESQDAVNQSPEAESAPEVTIEALVAERDELKDQVLRSRAEFDNYRKRVARETERIRKTAAGDLVRDLLPVVDNLERALEHGADASGSLAEGVGMVLKQLHDVLGQNGVEPIPAIGEPFDPNVHEAVTRMPSTKYPADVVAQEFQKGYRLGGYLLRPTKVVVSAGAPDEPGEVDETEQVAEANDE